MSSANPINKRTDVPIRLLDFVFMTANTVGVLLYLRLASRGWRIPQEHGQIPVTGEPFVWVLAVPVFAAFLVADICWGGLLLHHRQPKRWFWLLITAAVWFAAIYVDFAHH